MPIQITVNLEEKENHHFNFNITASSGENGATEHEAQATKQLIAAIKLTIQAMSSINKEKQNAH